MNDIHVDFAKYSLDKETKNIIKNGMSPLGVSLNKNRLFKFLSESIVENYNKMIDYYMSMPPKRQDNEEYDNYKARIKFSNLLLKYRRFLYDYSVFSKN